MTTRFSVRGRGRGRVVVGVVHVALTPRDFDNNESEINHGLFRTNGGKPSLGNSSLDNTINHRVCANLTPHIYHSEISVATC